MTTGDLVQFALTTGVTVFIAAITWWARRHPNRSKEYPERIRMPKVVPVVGWLFIGVGLLVGLMGWATPDGPLGARITSAAIFLGGCAFVGMYRNFYVAPRQHEVAFRTNFGTEHVLPYSDIADYRLRRLRRQPILTVKSIHGVKLTLNISTFDMGPMLRAIDYHQATGRWPVPADAVPARPAMRPVSSVRPQARVRPTAPPAAHR